eukprot:TRINITY_DN59843_c0_g1_i1.p1 TRINITY_DN59843_c0_g1~~TRINITY_DN59843_c0_g1_i1.p1  ORF type:complete len:174 (+),score=31.75 TRINITY_DN59843_c0_g1_i1:310-831(+)
MLLHCGYHGLQVVDDPHLAIQDLVKTVDVTLSISTRLLCAAQNMHFFLDQFHDILDLGAMGLNQLVVLVHDGRDQILMAHTQRINCLLRSWGADRLGRTPLRCVLPRSVLHCSSAPGSWLVILKVVPLAELLDTVSIAQGVQLSLIHISEPTRLLSISYAVFCLKKKKQHNVR